MVDGHGSEFGPGDSLGKIGKTSLEVPVKVPDRTGSGFIDSNKGSAAPGDILFKDSLSKRPLNSTADEDSQLRLIGLVPEDD